MRRTSTAASIRGNPADKAFYTPLVETIQFILERGRSDGIFRASIDARLLYMTMSSLCYHYLSNQFTLEIALGKDLTSEKSRQVMARSRHESWCFCTASLIRRR